MLLSQPVWRDFLSCCENIMAQIHCKYSTQSVVPVARKYLHVFAIGRSLTAHTEHFAIMTVTEQSAPLCCYDLCTVFMSETVFHCFPRIFQSLNYWTLCVHVFWWQIGLLLLTGTEIHRKTISRVTSRTTFGQTVPEKSTIHRNRGILLTMNTINEPSDDELELKVQLLLTENYFTNAS